MIFDRNYDDVSRTHESAWIRGVLAGAVSGAVGVALPFPFDSYRLKLLFFDKNNPALSKINLSLFHGISPAIMQGVLQRGISFGVYDSILSFLSPSGHYIRDPLFNYFVAGAGGSLAISIVREPFGVYRSRVQAGSTPHTSFFSFVLHSIRSNNGIKYLYSGFVSSSVTSMISRGTYFATYEIGKRILYNNKHIFHNTILDTEISSHIETTKSLPLWMRVMSATIAGPFSWVVIYPLDVVRARMRAIDPNAFPQKYKSFYHCFIETAREGALFRGLSLTLFRSAPMASITLPLYESVYIALGDIL